MAKYRTIDGSCNNLENPLWGSYLSQFERFMNPKYEDGKSYLLANLGHALPKITAPQSQVVMGPGQKLFTRVRSGQPFMVWV